MPRPPKLIARDARILAAHSAGATIPQIAAAEQIDPSLVRTTLRRHGVPCPSSRHPLDGATAARLADPAWLAAEYAAKSAPEIAEKLGCSRGQVFGALKRAGIARRRREEYAPLVRGWRTWPADVRERAVGLYCAGWAAPAVAEELGVSMNGVYALLRERGVVRSKSEAQRLANARRIAEDRERRVQRTIEQLQACNGDYASIHEELERKWLAWWDAKGERLQLSGSLVRQAYTLFLLDYLGLDPAEVPVVYEDDRRIVWRSANFCPMLEGCRRLGLDTRVVCRAATERSVETLIRRLDGRLRFGRNYEAGMRPFAAYCEEEIWLAE